MGLKAATLRIVYVLGAGAVAEAGLPLTREFFAREHRFDSRIYRSHYERNPRFTRLVEVYEFWKKTSPSLNMEDFFNYISSQSLMEQSFDITSADGQVAASTILRDLRWYIASYVVFRRRQQKTPPQEYWDFIQGLKNRGVRSGLITFNYDMTFDKLLLDIFREFNYGFHTWSKVENHGRMRHSTSGIPYLKLHGSVNWGRCDYCGTIHIEPDEIAQKINRERCRCGRGMLDPLVVPPAFDKNTYLNSITRLWRKATELMNDADQVVIAGYSLPLPDQSAKELLSSTLGRKNTDAEVQLVSPNIEVKQHFDSVLGRPVEWKKNTFCSYVRREFR